MINSDRDFRKVLVRAVRTAEAHYRRALAAEIDESEDPNRHWEAVRKVLARAMVISRLVSEARVASRIRALGGGVDLRSETEEIEEDEGSLEDPVRLAKEKFVDDIIDMGLGSLGPLFGPPEELKVRPFLRALSSFSRRVPRLRSRIDAILTESLNAATTLTGLERRMAIDWLSKTSSTVREMLASSFYVSDVDLGTTVDLKNLLADSIRGEPLRATLPDFVEKARLTGARGLTEARLETVFRTNLSTAYGDGQIEALSTPLARKITPLVMITEINDRRSRDTHKRMNGYVNTVDEIDRQGLRGPAGFNCRKGMRPVSRAEAKRLGLLDEHGEPDSEKIRSYNGERQSLIDRGLYPDPGFAVSR